MKKWVGGGVATAALLALAGCGGGEAEEVEALVEMWRLDCGTINVNDLNAFSQDDAYEGETKELVDSCYLIRHGEDYMIWDAGLTGEFRGKDIDAEAPMDASYDVPLTDQIRQVNLWPAKIDYIGVSHYHMDHVGQLPAFPNATLLIGEEDWAAVTSDDPSEMVTVEPFGNWSIGGGSVEPVSGDHDVFGDGTVVMLATPGHTPGHHSLLVMLDDTGPVMLTGDLAHFQENYDSNGIPDFNVDADQTIASFEAFKQRAEELGATVIIQHEPGDVGKLPAFPESAR